MANRSLLYGFDKFEDGMPSNPSIVHEWPSAISLSQTLLLSGLPRVYASSMRSAKVAVVSDFAMGTTRLLAFLRALVASGGMAEPEVFAKAVEETEVFLARPEVVKRFFLLEATEVFGIDKQPQLPQVAKLVDTRIPTLAKQVDALIEKTPAQLFVKAPTWLVALRRDWRKADLGITGWATGAGT